MDDLFPALLILISVVAGIISSAKKEKAKQDAETHRSAAAKSRLAAAQQKMKAAQTAAMQTEPIRPSIAPTVHPHMQPDCSDHDQPGSLGVTSLEGKDPCHEEQLSPLRTATTAVAAEKSGLTFDWSGENMVKAFVMQEVLTRPVQRRAR